MLIQNQSKRTYELKVGVIRPLGVIEVPDGEAEAILKAGLGELVAQHVIPRPHTDVEGILPTIK